MGRSEVTQSRQFSRDDLVTPEAIFPLLDALISHRDFSRFGSIFEG